MVGRGVRGKVRVEEATGGGREGTSADVHSSTPSSALCLQVCRRLRRTPERRATSGTLYPLLPHHPLRRSSAQLRRAWGVTAGSVRWRLRATASHASRSSVPRCHPRHTPRPSRCADRLEAAAYVGHHPRPRTRSPGVHASQA
eukprot:scaffold20728_cov132-Isochrysis_galbana.AAC.14